MLRGTPLWESGSGHEVGLRWFKVSSLLGHGQKVPIMCLEVGPHVTGMKLAITVTGIKYKYSFKLSWQGSGTLVAIQGNR